MERTVCDYKQNNTLFVQSKKQSQRNSHESQSPQNLPRPCNSKMGESISITGAIQQYKYTETNKNRQYKWSKTETVYCICRRSEGGKLMIFCDSCYEWYHGDCVIVTPEMGTNTNTYKCPLYVTEDT